MAQCRNCGAEVEYRRVYGKPIAYDTSTTPWTEHKCGGRGREAKFRSQRIQRELEEGFVRAIDKEEGQ